MSDVMEYIKKLQFLEQKIEWFKFSRTPITEEKISFVEKRYHITMNEDLKQILTTVGCTYWSFNDISWNSLLLSNDECRKFYTDKERASILKRAFIFSDDGTGNPILVDTDGSIYILYHDDIDHEKLEGNLSSLMKKFTESFSKNFE